VTEHHIQDDHQDWGYIDPDGEWMILPKLPMLRAGLGPPPFEVTLPSGEKRGVCHRPEGFDDPVCSVPLHGFVVLFGYRRGTASPS
jgi:hypothetical protein